MNQALILILLLWSARASAQESSRAAEIEAARGRKAAELTPDQPSDVERNLTLIKDRKLVERLSTGFNGLGVKFGGLATGGGFALGPQYTRGDLSKGRMQFRTSAVFSFQNFQKYDLQYSVIPDKSRPLFFQTYIVRHSYPNIPYYGPGPDSKKTGRSTYLYEDLALDATTGIRFKKRFLAVASGGYLFVNLANGTDTRFAPISRNFPAVPGVDSQPDFARTGGYLEFDGTDFRPGPRRGTYLLAGYNRHIDQIEGRYSFDRFDADFQQYIPFFNQRRVIAVRGKANLTFTDAGRTVPFYMQPVLGGSDDLRGFRPYRFYGNNLMVWNAEYRWEVFSGMDMALFFDAGKVTDKRSQINFHNLESSAGFGLRFNSANAVFVRLDVGFSHEGFQVWFKFNNIFVPKKVISSSSQVVE